MRKQDEHVEALRPRPFLLNVFRRSGEKTGRAGRRAAALCLCLVLLAATSCARFPSHGKGGRQSGPFENGMAVSADRLATLAGLEVLRNGGNAVDAAVAMGFALAVTFPRAGNLGGGGFMMIYLADRGEAVAVDYREKAPEKATRDMFLDWTVGDSKQAELHLLPRNFILHTRSHSKMSATFPHMCLCAHNLSFMHK